MVATVLNKQNNQTQKTGAENTINTTINTMVELQDLFDMCRLEILTTSIKDLLPNNRIYTNITLNRCTKSLGRCCLSYNKLADKTYNVRYGMFQIEVSKHLLGCSKELVRNVILHEFIHTLPNCWSHDYNFRYYANILNRELNANIETKNSSDEFKNNISKVAKYEITCLKCGKVFYRNRLPHGCKVGTEKTEIGCTHTSCGGKIVARKIR